MGTVKNTEQEITQDLPHLNAKYKKAVLSVVKTFAAEQRDWWDAMGQEQQGALDRSIAEMNAGKVTAHKDVLKKYKKWQRSN